MGGANRADSTRKGYAASVTLLRREQLREVVRPYDRCGVRRVYQRLQVCQGAPVVTSFQRNWPFSSVI